LAKSTKVPREAENSLPAVVKPMGPENRCPNWLCKGTVSKSDLTAHLYLCDACKNYCIKCEKNFGPDGAKENCNAFNRINYRYCRWCRSERPSGNIFSYIKKEEQSNREFKKGKLRQIENIKINLPRMAEGERIQSEILKIGQFLFCATESGIGFLIDPVTGKSESLNFLTTFGERVRFFDTEAFLIAWSTVNITILTKNAGLSFADFILNIKKLKKLIQLSKEAKIVSQPVVIHLDESKNGVKKTSPFLACVIEVQNEENIKLMLTDIDGKQQATILVDTNKSLDFDTYQKDDPKTILKAVKNDNGFYFCVFAKNKCWISEPIKEFPSSALDGNLFHAITLQNGFEIDIPGTFLAAPSVFYKVENLTSEQPIAICYIQCESNSLEKSNTICQARINTEDKIIKLYPIFDSGRLKIAAQVGEKLLYKNKDHHLIYKKNRYDRTGFKIGVIESADFCHFDELGNLFVNMAETSIRPCYLYSKDDDCFNLKSLDEASSLEEIDINVVSIPIETDTKTQIPVVWEGMLAVIRKTNGNLSLGFYD